MDGVMLFLHIAMSLGCVAMIIAEIASKNLRGAIWPLNCLIWVVIAWVRF